LAAKIIAVKVSADNLGKWLEKLALNKSIRNKAYKIVVDATKLKIP
jgi:hypothetical protein